MKKRNQKHRLNAECGDVSRVIGRVQSGVPRGQIPPAQCRGWRRVSRHRPGPVGGFERSNPTGGPPLTVPIGLTTPHCAGDDALAVQWDLTGRTPTGTVAAR